MRLGARSGRLAAGLLAAALLLFVLPARLPGGTEGGLLAARAGDPVARASLHDDLHLGRPLPLRFVLFLTDAARGDLGYSPVSRVDVGAVVGERLLDSVVLAAAAGALAFLLTRRRRARRRAADDAPAPSAVPSAAWVLPLIAAVIVADRFGSIPAPDPHAAIVTRIGAGLLPAATLGVALAVWTAFARRTVRDQIAAVLIGTLVTEAVFGLPGLGSLLATAATRPDPMVLRGALFVLAVVAVVAIAALVPVGTAAGDFTGGRSTMRRTANGAVGSLWVLAVAATTLGRLHLRLAPAARIGTDAGSGISAAHPFGTDALGRDVLARVLATARGSLLLVVAAMIIAMIVGTAIGVIVGFAGGRLERIGIAVLGGWAAFPGELVALSFLAFNGRGGTAAAFALALVAIPTIAFGAQRRTLDALQRADPHLESAPFLRDVASSARPGLIRATLATMFVGASRVVAAELVAGLLGLGPTATQTWSHEASMQLSFAAQAPLAVIAPVAVALVTAIAFAGLGNAIRAPRTA